ncbi:MAG TPA: hypothetical protein VHK91_18180 [Flavisolibacter sp.]|jgi:hypothetical protein|nr:hypothetical protein [Flavisolibacter sp.]
MKHIVLLFSLLALLLCGPAFSQQFGGFPPSTKWKQIDSDTARIIFIRGAEEQAARIASLIHKAALDTPASLGNNLRKINVVLQSRTTQANGYVALAPFRSEYYLVPGSNIFDFGNLPWQDNLALHEYRHVQQYNNFRRGISKGFYYLFGEQGQAFANAITIPDWFFEGDAVHTETALSEQGRGRLSYFLSGYRALWLEGRHYNWQKLRNGSLKDYVPNHYQLGYLLTNYGYMTYGADFWKKVTQDASAFKGLFYPFQKAITHYSGKDYTTFRQQALDFYKKELPESAVPATKNRTVTRYYNPIYTGKDSLVYLKTAYNKLPAFYLQQGGKEHKVSLQSISTEEWFSYRNGILAYTAYSTHPRWGSVDYSDLVLLDMATGKERRISSRQKYYTPDLSPDGKSLIAIRINDSLQTELRLLDAATGAVLKSFPSVQDYYYTNPRFIDAQTIVVGTRTPDSKMALQQLNLQSGAWELLTPWSMATAGLPSVSNGIVYYTANYDGNDDLYSIDTRTHKVLQLTKDLTGNYYPSVYGDSLVYTHFTAQGNVLQKLALKGSAFPELTADRLSLHRAPYPIALSGALQPFWERFAEKRYPQSKNLFNFHSWAPDYEDPEFTFSLYGNNILNTFSNTLFYRYNQNEDSHGAGWNGSYGGLFTAINGGLEYTFNRHLPFSGQTVTLDQLEARIGLSVPLNFTKGKTYKYLNAGSDFVHNKTVPTGASKSVITGRTVNYLQHFLTWTQLLPRAVQHIYPKLGYAAALYHRHALSREGYQFLGNGQIYLPAPGNHSIVLAGSVQETDTSNIIFSNRFSNSRGYPDYYYSRMWKAAANYHFPIAYPDLGLASIVYFQRIRGNVFYDLTRIYSRDKSQSRDLRSTGGELYFDTKWWNQLPVSFGIRYSYLLDADFSGYRNKWELIIPISLIPD